MPTQQQGVSDLLKTFIYFSIIKNKIYYLCFLAYCYSKADRDKNNKL